MGEEWVKSEKQLFTPRIPFVYRHFRGLGEEFFAVPFLKFFLSLFR